ncbi:MobB protein, partial [Pseudomonas sp. FSL R10-1350]|nr:MobB protein [Pseudomonas sp. FSL R10-1350]
MSGISDLARSFEEKSKQQAIAIETGVTNAYKQHEQTLLAALRSSEQSL